MKTKLNFTIPTDVAGMLKELVADRQRSSFVADAIRERLQKVEQERLRQELIEGYGERRREDAELNDEWEAATLEGWQ